MENSRRPLYILGLVATFASVPLETWTVAHAQRFATSNAERPKAAQRITVNMENTPLVSALATIAQQAGLTPFFDPGIIPPAKRVTLHLHDVPPAEAFEQALRGTGLIANVFFERNVAIVRSTGVAITAVGVITGRVTAALTKQPLGGAKVGLDGTDRVAETSADGSYRLSNVSEGSHTLTVRLLGYARVVRTVLVQGNITATVDVALDVSATPLDQVVVTGTVIPTELKAVPNAITVITAKQLEERGITHIDQLFRGDVPGVFAANLGSGTLFGEVTMFSRGATALSPSSAGTTTTNGGTFMFTNPIKTYVDGVELADPQYLSQIDPKSVERIEILAGPQASTIYGSNAMNGVMQIFTKRGASKTPQLTLNLLSGFVQNNFRPTKTPQHDYSGQLNGIEGRFSYNVGGSWNYVGPWTPAKQTTQTSGFGGARLELPTTVGRMTADLTLRRHITQNLQRGSSQQTQTDFRETGWWSNINASGRDRPTTYTLTGQTLGFAGTYVPVAWWSHEFEIGFDVSDTEQRFTERGYQFTSDTSLNLTQNHTDRRSLRYATTARLPVSAFGQATVTAGADAWQNLTSSWSISPQTLTGTLTGSTSVSRQPGHNTGGFLQTQVGILDHLFLTYGLRAEWNPGYGTQAEPNYAPRYGAAFTQEMGPVTTKLRASYGRSTRPPTPTYKNAVTAIAYYGPSSWSFLSLDYPNFDRYVANPDLSPEHQQGGEGGLELYLGARGSLVITRYNQTVDGLINAAVVDSVRSLSPNPPCCTDGNNFRDAGGYGYRYEYQYVNLGSIRNQGWELQGSVNTGPLTTRGTYSWTKSRTIGVDPRYRSRFTIENGYPQYQPGATFQYVPEHTWALGVTYTRSTTTLGLNMTGIGRVTTLQDALLLGKLHPNIRLPQNRLRMLIPPGYTSSNRGYTIADVTALHQFLSRVEGVLQVQNVTDRYQNDFWANYATLGRQLKLGVRVRP